MSRWVALKNELSIDPESRGYASMTPVQVAADMNDLRYVGRGFTLTFPALLEAVDIGVARRFYTALQASSDSLHIELLQAMRGVGADFGEPKVRTLIGALGLTNPDALALRQVADNKSSRAQTVFGRKVTPEDIVRVRSGT